MIAAPDVNDGLFLFLSFLFAAETKARCETPHAREPETEWYDGRRLVLSRRGGELCKPDWVEQRIAQPHPCADGLVSRSPGARRETTVLRVWRKEREGGRSMGGASAKGGNWKEEGARRRRRHGCCFSSLFPLSLSHTLFC